MRRLKVRIAGCERILCKFDVLCVCALDQPSCWLTLEINKPSREVASRRRATEAPCRGQQGQSEVGERKPESRTSNGSRPESRLRE